MKRSCRWLNCEQSKISEPHDSALSSHYLRPTSHEMVQPAITTGSVPTFNPALKSDIQLDIAAVGPSQVGEHDTPSARKGFNFWMIFLAICVSLFLSALELTAVSTALPTITHDLNGTEDFVWIASAYSLASTALLPASGGLAEIFGRRTAMLIALGLFFLGSALCGAAPNMGWLIAARTVQGAGGGGILSLSSIILSDLVTLKERGLYNGIIGMTWSCAASIGPLVGGALAQGGNWRWLFYLNLPIAGLAAVLVLGCLKLRTPPGTLQEKLGRMDWIGNVIVVSSSSACVIALTWGGVKYPWTSPHILVPLILGLLGICFFVFYEARFAKEPLLPLSLLSNRTSVSGYIQTFLNPIVVFGVVYFQPIFYQACKGSSAIRSGVEASGLAMTLGPFLIITGASVAVTKKYRQQLWLGWSLLTIAMGLMSTLHPDTSNVNSIGFLTFVGVGGGIVYSATYFPVLAPLPVSENAHALAFFSFCRSFAAVWSVTIGTAVLQTQLTKHLPAEFTAQFPGGVTIAYSAIPSIASLPEPLRSQVRAAFADSLIVIWQVMIGIAGTGFLSCFLMEALPLHTQVNERWGLEETEQFLMTEERQNFLG